MKRKTRQVSAQAKKAIQRKIEIDCIRQEVINVWKSIGTIVFTTFEELAMMLDLPNTDYIKEGFKLYTVGGTICAVEMTDGKSVGTVYAFMVNQKYKNNIEGNVRAIKINYRKFLGAVIDNNM